jgi:hypothetical protein
MIVSIARLLRHCSTTKADKRKLAVILPSKKRRESNSWQQNDQNRQTEVGTGGANWLIGDPAKTRQLDCD